MENSAAGIHIEDLYHGHNSVKYLLTGTARACSAWHLALLVMSHAALTIIGELNLSVGARCMAVVMTFAKRSFLFHRLGGEDEDRRGKGRQATRRENLLSYILHRSTHYDKLYSARKN
ncbi:unnamed protein product [Caretta caretta]